MNEQTESSAPCKTLVDKLLYRERVMPEALYGAFLEAGHWRDISVAEFVTRARKFAALLHKQHMQQGELVPIILRDPLNSQAAFMGAMIAGAIPSFLPYPNARHNTTLYWTQHRTLFHRLRPRLIIVYDELFVQIEKCLAELECTVLCQSEADGQEPHSIPYLSGPDEVALLQHSSGTTGLKKGVALTHGAVIRQLVEYEAALGLSHVNRATIASWLPLYHDMGLVSSFLLPLWVGVPMITLDPFEWIGRPELFFEAVELYRATHAWLPNFAFMHLARSAKKSDRYDLSSLVALVNCSEPCKPDAFDTFLQKFAGCGLSSNELQTCYAMAETVFAVTQSVPGKPPRRLTVDRNAAAQGIAIPIENPKAGICLISNGPPIGGAEIAILVRDEFMDRGQIGEICVRAPYMFSGYYKNPEDTSRAFHEDWYRTGDIGFVDEGEIFIVGRLKDLIIVNGKNIYPHDVEAAVSTVNGVKRGRAVAIGVYDNEAGSERLVVIAEASECAPPARELIQAINRSVLEQVGVICSDVEIVEQAWLVKTTSGKISRVENLRKYLSEFS